jgi:hypothetical protein
MLRRRVSCEVIDVRRIVTLPMAMLLVMALSPWPMGATQQGSLESLDAEGCLLLMNLGMLQADADAELLKEEQSLIESALHAVGPETFKRVLRSEAAGLWGGSVVVTSNAPIGVSRQLVWSDPRGGTQLAASSRGATALSKTWHVGVGITSPGFTSWIVLQEVTGVGAEVSVKYITKDGAVTGPSVELEAFMQEWIDVRTSLPDEGHFSAVIESTEPIVAQMMLEWAGGLSMRTTMGVAAPSTLWYLAEANTWEWSGFGDPSVYVTNPTAEKARGNLGAILDGTYQDGPEFSIPAMSQTVLNLAEWFPGHPHLNAVVSSTVPVVAMQRTSWDDGRGINPTMGLTEPSVQWGFLSTAPDETFSTWISVQNPSNDPTAVSIDLMTPEGAVPGPRFELGPFGRHSISADELGQVDMADVAIVLTATHPILGEQGTYWQCGDDVHRDLDFGVPEMSDFWCLPVCPRTPTGP